MALKIYLSVLLVLLVIGGTMITLLETGRRIGKHRMKLDPDNAHQGFGALEASVFGL